MIDIKDFNYRYFLIIHRQLVIASGFLLAGFLIIVFAILPQFTSLGEQQAKITKESKSVSTLQRKSLALEDAETLQIVDNADRIDSALPSKKPLLELMTSINQVSGWTNVEITNIELTPGDISTDSATQQATRRSKSSKISNYDEMSVDLVISGKLGDINDFFQQVERVVPITNITKISLNELKRTGAVSYDENDVFEAELTLSSFYFTQSISAALETPLVSLGAEEAEFIQKLSTFSFPLFDEQRQIEGGGQIDLFGLDTEVEVP